MTPATQIAYTPERRGGTAAAAALLAAIFALVYARSLAFVYIEGDDATSIAYHALGRVRAIQPPYSAYQCMMDAILRLLPAQEPVLRVAAMTITAVAAPILMLLIVMLAFDWAGEEIRISRAAAALVLALAAPELIYLGLLYTPALVALAAAIGAHLLIRGVVRRAPGWGVLRDARFWISVALFGAGVACRWDVLAYGAIVAADLWFGPRLAASPGRPRFAAAVLWGTAALAAWFGAVALCGYGPGVVWKTLRTAGPVEDYPSLTVAAATMQTLATPALLLLAAAGFAVFARRRNPLAVLALLGVALTARFLPLGVPKWFLVAVPALAACALAGFSILWNARTATPLLRTALALCLAAPWLLGVQTLSGDSAYGPGFQVRPFNRPPAGRSFIRPVIGAGALVPTSEGPRPIGGHAFVLLGGGWRRTVQSASNELQTAAREAIARRLPILQDMGQGFVVSTLAGMGFTTHDAWKLPQRTFLSADGATSVRVVRARTRDDLFRPEGQREIEALSGGSRVIAYAYTSTLRRLYRRAPDSLQSLGATAAVIDFDKLRAPVDKMAVSAPGRLP